jgi:hypothetical protein
MIIKKIRTFLFADSFVIYEVDIYRCVGMCEVKISLYTRILCSIFKKIGFFLLKKIRFGLFTQLLRK